MLGLGTSLSSLYVPQGSSYTNAYSVEFDGSDDQIQIANTNIEGVIRGSFTFTAWLKIPSNSNQGWFGLFNNNNNHVYIGLNSSNFDFVFTSNSDAGQTRYTSGLSIPTNAWFHFAATAEKTGTGSGAATQLRMFINGAALSSPNDLSELTGDNHGAFDAGSTDFNIGVTHAAVKMVADTQIHDFSIHNNVLSAAAIAVLYNGGDGSIDQTLDSGSYSSSTLAAYYKLDEGTGITANDSAKASPVNGTLANGASWSSSVPG